jgi:hypothetical protein
MNLTMSERADGCSFRHSKERVGAIEIHPVEALRHDTVEIALRPSEDELLPLGIPELDGIVPRPPAVLFVQPGRFMRGIVPLLVPVGAIAFRLADRQIGEQDAGAAVRAPAHARHFVGLELTLEGPIGGNLAVDHQQIVRRGGNSRNVERAEPVPPVFDHGHALPERGHCARRLRQLNLSDCAWWRGDCTR